MRDGATPKIGVWSSPGLRRKDWKMLDRLDEPVQEGHRKQLGHLGRERLKALCELLRAARREP
jgi:hypothetical protein